MFVRYYPKELFDRISIQKVELAQAKDQRRSLCVYLPTRRCTGDQFRKLVVWWTEAERRAWVALWLCVKPERRDFID